MSLFGTITEGGQTWAHRFRMLRQVVKLASLASFIICLMLFASLLLKVPLMSYQSTWYYAKANTIGLLLNEISVDAEYWEKVARQRHADPIVQVDAKKVSKYSGIYAAQFLENLADDMKRLGGIYSVLFLSILCFFFIRGSLGKRKKHLSGSKITASWWLSFKLKFSRKASPYKIGSLPLIKGTETQHISVTGGTGSGKTNCFHHILPQIQKYRHKALIVDTTGAFVERYYRPGKDIILNPFDDRGVAWHPWVECLNNFDYEALAESFIPQTFSQHDNYWRTAARTLMSAILQKTADSKKTSDLSNWILFQPLLKLCSFVQGTKAAAHLDMSSEKTAGSIRSVATTFLQCLEYIQDTSQPFSIREWIKDEKADSWLFLHCNPSQRAALNPLLSCWFSVATRNLMQMNPNFNRRIWFVIDELPSMNRLSELESFVCESRKYGGCGIFAYQSPAQLEAIYGSSITKTIIGNCMTKIVFSEQDPEIATLISKAFGERETQEYQEGLSYGAHETRDAVSLSLQTKRTPLISTTAIQTLAKNEAYVKLPGNIASTKIKLPIIKKTC